MADNIMNKGYNIKEVEPLCDDGWEYLWEQAARWRKRQLMENSDPSKGAGQNGQPERIDDRSCKWRVAG